jgi:catalase (peroxidase I)
VQNIGLDKWPKCGGANGSIRFDPEMGHGANTGLTIAVALLEPIKAQFPDIGYADLFQLASATAVEVQFLEVCRRGLFFVQKHSFMIVLRFNIE